LNAPTTTWFFSDGLAKAAVLVTHAARIGSAVTLHPVM